MRPTGVCVLDMKLMFPPIYTTQPVSVPIMPINSNRADR